MKDDGEVSGSGRVGRKPFFDRKSGFPWKKERDESEKAEKDDKRPRKKSFSEEILEAENYDGCHQDDGESSQFSHPADPGVESWSKSFVGIRVQIVGECPEDGDEERKAAGEDEGFGHVFGNGGECEDGQNQVKKEIEDAFRGNEEYGTKRKAARQA